MKRSRKTDLNRFCEKQYEKDILTLSVKQLEDALQKITKKSTSVGNSDLVLLNQKEILATWNIYKYKPYLQFFNYCTPCGINL